MINLVNKDRCIYALEYRVADIVEEYQRTGKLDISTNSEGICLCDSKFYDLLDYITKKFKIDKSKITIYTNNSLEKHGEYNIVIYENHFISGSLLRPYIPKKVVDKIAIEKHVSCFVGKPNWNRLVLSAYLYNNFKEKSLQSYNYQIKQTNRSNTELSDVAFYMPDELDSCVQFLKEVPLILDQTYIAEHYAGYFDLVKTYYHKIFLDLVLETYVSGNTFFPTEKTVRPIIANTPFIIMGPKNYLNNLKKLGYKTFNQWWDESYDCYEGAPRIEAIKKTIKNIMTWPESKMLDIINEMQEVLKHNYNTFISIK